MERLFEVIAFFLGVALMFFIYWFGGGDFERGPGLAMTAVYSIITGIVALVLLKVWRG